MFELYIKDGCPHCQAQIKQLKQEGLCYRLHNVSLDHDALTLKETKDKYGADTVPLLIEDGKAKSVGCYQDKG